MVIEQAAEPGVKKGWGTSFLNKYIDRKLTPDSVLIFACIALSDSMCVDSGSPPRNRKLGLVKCAGDTTNIQIHT